jgi:hypothetical protein
MGALEGGTGADGAPSGAYYQAPMTSNGVTLRADYSPGGAFSGGLQFKAVNEGYRYPSTIGGPVLTPANLVNQVQGVKSDYNFTVGVDGNYRPVEGVNLHAYYTYEQIYFSNQGNGACADSNAPPLCTGSAGFFQNKQTTDVDTVGVSGDWQATDRLKLGLNYTFSYGAVMFGQFNGVFVPLNSITQTYQNVVNYPDNKSVMNAITVKASYQLTPNTVFSVAGMPAR